MGEEAVLRRVRHHLQECLNKLQSEKGFTTTGDKIILCKGVTLVMVVSGIATVWFFVADGLLVSAISAVLFLLALFKFWKNGSDESLEGVWFHDLRDVVDRTPQDKLTEFAGRSATRCTPEHAF